MDIKTLYFHVIDNYGISKLQLIKCVNVKNRTSYIEYINYIKKSNANFKESNTILNTDYINCIKKSNANFKESNTILNTDYINCIKKSNTNFKESNTILNTDYINYIKNKKFNSNNLNTIDNYTKNKNLKTLETINEDNTHIILNTDYLNYIKNKKFKNKSLSNKHKDNNLELSIIKNNDFLYDMHPSNKSDKLKNKTLLCQFYNNGFCKKGTKCNFAHGYEELLYDKQ